MSLEHAFRALGEPGSLGAELSDEQLLDEVFGEVERGSLNKHSPVFEHSPLEAPSRLLQPTPESESESELEPPATELRRVSKPGTVALLALCFSAVASVLALFAINVPLQAGIGQNPSRGPSPRGAAMMNAPADRVRIAHPGERHELGDKDCRRVGAKLELCSSGSASFRVGEHSRAQAIELELESGELELAGQRSGGSIELSTPVAKVIQGTIGSRFRVSFDRARAHLHVEVISGEVTIERIGGQRVSLGAGAQLGLGLEPPTPPAPKLAPTPRSRVERASPKPNTHEASLPTPQSLLAAAQRELAAGDQKAARRRYRELVDQFPTSAAGLTARVSLGRMLTAAGDLRGALDEFDTYINQASGQRPLIQEAHYGRIRCLRALGRTSEAREAIDDFTQRYPGSLHRHKLDNWRIELESEIPL